MDLIGHSKFSAVATSRWLQPSALYKGCGLRDHNHTLVRRVWGLAVGAYMVDPPTPLILMGSGRVVLSRLSSIQSPYPAPSEGFREETVDSCSRTDTSRTSTSTGSSSGTGSHRKSAMSTIEAEAENWECHHNVICVRLDCDHVIFCDPRALSSAKNAFSLGRAAQRDGKAEC